MAGYIGANTSSVTNNQNAAERRKKFTFTAATTSLTGLNFLPNKIHIFHNGIRLVKDTDFTEASDGKSVTLTNAAQAGDEVVAVTFSQAPTTDVVPASTGGTFSDAVTIDSNGATALTVDRATSDGTVIDVQKDGTTVGSVASRAGVALQVTSSTLSGLDLATDINPMDNGSLSDNAISLGNAGNRFADLYLGGGAYIGGTTSSNYLDDYEEGTWTPSIQGTSTAGTHNVISRFGTYVKIGRLVYLNFGYNANSGTGSGDLLLSGIPFTVNNSQHTGHGGGFQYNSGVSYPSGYYEAQWVLNTSNYTSFYLRCNHPTGGNLDYIPYPTAPSYIRGTLFYEI